MEELILSNMICNLSIFRPSNAQYTHKHWIFISTHTCFDEFVSSLGNAVFICHNYVISKVIVNKSNRL